MKVINTEKRPIKLWLEDIEDGAMAQAKNIAYNAENKSDAICNGCYGLLLARGEILKGEK